MAEAARHAQAWAVMEKQAGDAAAAREVFRLGNTNCPMCAQACHPVAGDPMQACKNCKKG